LNGVRDWYPTAAGIVLLRRFADGKVKTVLRELESQDETILAEVHASSVELGYCEINGNILTTVLKDAGSDLMQISLPQLPERLK